MHTILVNKTQKYESSTPIQKNLIHALRDIGYSLEMSIVPLYERNAKDLGRFGLGLKIASFSQYGKLTVISSKNYKTNSAVWDLNYV